MADEKVVIGIATDASGVAPGVNEAKNALNQLGMAGKEAGKQASMGLDEMGNSADGASDKMNRATKSIASQIQRQTVAFQTAGKTAADYFEQLAKVRPGIDAKQLEPYIRSLREAEQAQTANAASMGQVGLTAKQMSASLRGLPAQFTDIFTSLASGQKPTLVLLQQGGQIKDMFGGIVPAAKAVGGALLNMINPFTIAAGAVAALALAYSQGAEEERAFSSALIDSGNAAGTTVSNLTAMAERMDAFTGATQGAASEALVEFVRTGRVAQDQLEDFTAAAINLERAGGQSIKDTAKAFADLSKDPVKSLEKLNEGMNFLSVAAYQQVKALEDVGRETDAARLAQKLYADAIKDRTAEMESNLGLIEKAWRAIKDVTKEAWDAIKEIGRASTDAQKLLAVQEQIAYVQEKLDKAGAGPNVERFQRELVALRERESILQSEIRLQQRAADQQRIQAENVRLMIEYEKNGEQFKTKQIKMEEEIAKVTELRKRDLISIEEAEKRISLIHEKYKDTGKKGDPFAAAREQGKLYAEIMEKVLVNTAAAEKELASLTKTQSLLNALLQNPLFQTMPEQWRQTALQVMYTAIAKEQNADVDKEIEKLREQSLKDQAKAIAQYENETLKIEGRTKKLELEAQQIGKKAGVQKDLEAATIDLQIAELEQYRTSQLVYGATEQDVSQISRRIDALKDLKDAILAVGTAKDAKQAADDAEKAWLNAGKNISSSLTDSLVRGFEDGKGFVDNLIDYIKTAFKTAAVKLVIEPTMRGVVGSGLSLLGAPAGAVSKLTGGSGAGSGGTGFTSLLSSLGTVGTLGGSFATGLQGTLAGFSEFGFGGIASGLTDIAGFASYGTLNGALAALGAAVPYIAAAVAIYSIVKKIRSNKSSPAIQNFSYLDALGGSVQSPWVTPNLASGTAYDSEIKTLISSVNATVKALGGTVNENLRYGLLTSISPDNKGGQVAAEVGNFGVGMLYNYNVNGPNDTVEARIEEVIPRMVLAGLMGSNLSDAFKEFFGQLDIETATQEQLDAAIEMATSAQIMAESTKHLGRVFIQLSDISVEARTSILGMVGGLDQFLSKASTFVDLYYSEQEKMAIQGYEVAKVLAESGLNISGLDTKQEFRDMFERLDASTEEGQRQIAAMLNVAGQFAMVSDYLVNKNIDLDELSGGIVNRILGTTVVVGPSKAIPDKIEEAAPWLADLKEFWTGTAQAISEPMTNLNNSLVEVGSSFAQGMSDLSSAVTTAVADALNRPVNVTVTVDASQVNGGAIR